MVCQGNSSEFCGAGSHLSLYGINSSVLQQSTTNSLSSTVTSSSMGLASSGVSNLSNYTYVGCYTDSNTRTLSSTSTSMTSMSLEYCASFCSGYLYFGTEYGQECYCGNIISSSASLATDGRCVVSCAGSSSEVCGGSWGLSLYAISQANGSVTTLTTVSATISSSTNTTLSPSQSVAPLVTCPSANGTTYMTPDGMSFLLECYIDHEAGDLSMVYTDTYGACAVACSNTPPCVAFSWIPPGPSSPCYMKSSIGASNYNPNVWGAKAAPSESTSSSTYPSSSIVSYGSNSSSHTSSATYYSSQIVTARNDSESVMSSSPSLSSNRTSMTVQTSSYTISVSANSSVVSYSANSSVGATATPSTMSSTGSFLLNTTAITTVPTTISSSETYLSLKSQNTTSTTTVPTITSPYSTYSGPKSLNMTSSFTAISSSSASASSTVANWVYAGCANDTVTKRALTVKPSLTNSTGMTVEMCQKYCNGMNYPLSGVEYAQECYCGLSLSSGSSIGYSGCNMACKGNPSETCGGSLRLSLYNNTNFAYPKIPFTAANYTFVGCYTDNTSARTLRNYSTSSTTSMTVESCTAICAAKHYAYAGVEYAAECYCANSIASGALLANAADCNMFCSGTKTEFCGGPDRIQIYH
jgi:WSC domain/PAN domain